MPLPAPYRRLAVAGLLAAHVVLLLGSIRQNFVVVDETAHIPSGLALWRTGDTGLYRVNPPLPRALAALPLVCADLVLPAAGDARVAGERPEFDLGRAFADANAPRYLGLVRLARLAGVAWSLLGAWLVMRWAGELYGDDAGLLALAMWCFEPTVLAFAPVALPDLPASVAALAAGYAFWKYLRVPSLAGAALAGLLLGVALLTKLTLLVLCVVWPILWLARVPRPRPAHAAVLAVVALLVVNAGYGFRDTGRPLRDFHFCSRALAGPPASGAGSYEYGEWGNGFRDWPAWCVCPVPADYLLGIDSQRRDFEAGGRSYLRGEVRHRGWWYYYLYALAVKVPLGFLALYLAGLALGPFGSKTCRLSEACLWLPAAAAVALVSSQTGFCHHFRYILPAFPFAVVAAGKLAGRLPASIVLALWCWGAVSSAAVHPHSLAYFNEAAGGPDGGHEHLLDSNIDFGQDLLFLKSWLDRNPQPGPIGLAYYNYADPRLAGIDYVLPPEGPAGIFLDDEAYQRRLGPRPGTFAVSANMLHGLSGFAPDGAGGIRPIRAGAYAYFRHFRPVAKAGPSIFIYRITPAEADAVRGSSPPPR